MEHVMHASNDFTDVFVTSCWLLDCWVGGKKTNNTILKILHTHFKDLEVQNACSKCFGTNCNKPIDWNAVHKENTYQILNNSKAH